MRTFVVVAFANWLESRRLQVTFVTTKHTKDTKFRKVIFSCPCLTIVNFVLLSFRVVAARANFQSLPDDLGPEENSPRRRRVRREKNFINQNSELCDLCASAVSLLVPLWLRLCRVRFFVVNKVIWQFPWRPVRPLAKFSYNRCSGKDSLIKPGEFRRGSAEEFLPTTLLR